MLQEILLSLAGVSSPIWQKLKDRERDADDLHDYVSLPEQAMLAELHQISQLHIQLRQHCATMSSKHPSMICRAISASIVHTHLAAFRQSVVDVEKSILNGDSTHVGGYQIVPLSTLVADFAPWARRLDWLRKLTETMRGDKCRRSSPSCTSARILNYLEMEQHKGYTDLENIATALLVVAQNTWMRAVASWTLYGQLPMASSEDFMIKRDATENSYEQYVLDDMMVPGFVSTQAAESILAIGNALRHAQTPVGAGCVQTSQSVAASLLTSHLEKIKALKFPLNSSLFESTMLAMNESISCHTLSTLLPKSQVIKVCKVLQDYMLICRGEFAVTLIENCDTRIDTRTKTSSTTQPARKLGRVDNMIIKDSELSAILSKTWSDLMSFQGDFDTEDSTLELAKALLRFNVGQDTKNQEKDSWLSTILPTPTFLSLEIIPTSPVQIFLTRTNVQQYSRISSYLLSIRRSQLRVSSLWKMTSHRRCHPTPLGPPLSTTEFGRRACQQRRAREDDRASRMRRFWSLMNKSLFLLNELNAYLHNEVIGNSWDRFERWLLHSDNKMRDRSRHVSRQSSQERVSLREGEDEGPRRQLESSPRNSLSNSDPRAMANAHSTYLTALTSALLLDETPLISLMKTLLGLLDHVIALFTRLSTIWEGLDLQEDEGVMDAFSNFAQDEHDVITEMDRARNEIEPLLKQIIETIRDIDKAQTGDETYRAMAGLRITDGMKGEFVPWRARVLDRLIMKLDFLYTREEDTADPVDELDYE